MEYFLMFAFCFLLGVAGVKVPQWCAVWLTNRQSDKELREYGKQVIARMEMRRKLNERWRKDL